jgi:hypothetical protein
MNNTTVFILRAKFLCLDAGNNKAFTVLQNFWPPPWLIRGITCCVPRSKNYISCVPRWPLQVYQLRPGLSTPSMTSCDAVIKEMYPLCTKLSASCILLVSRVVNRKLISRIKIYGYSKCPAIWRFLHSFIVHQFVDHYMHTYRSAEWYRQCTDVISCCCLIFKPYWKNIYVFWGSWEAHYVPNIVHFKLFLWSDENTFCGKSCNTVSFAVSSTWPLSYAHPFCRYACVICH